MHRPGCLPMEDVPDPRIQQIFNQTLELHLDNASEAKDDVPPTSDSVELMGSTMKPWIGEERAGPVHNNASGPSQSR